MPSQIITKNSVTGSAVPTTSDLVRGELALNLTDGRIYSRDEGTTIVELGTNPSTIAITAGTIDGTVIGGTTTAAISGTTGQFSTSLNVDGTATMDGLEVKSDGAIVQVSSADYDVALLGRRGSSGTDLDKGFMRLRDTGTTKVVIDSAGSTYFNGGNVGIGTDSPTDKLTLDSGQMRLSDSYGIRWGSASTAIYGSGGAGTLQMYTNSSEAMRIDSSGNVMVGKTGGSTTETGHQIFPSGQMYIYSPSTEAMRFYETSGSGQQVGSISITASATAYNTSSDYRLKDITGSLQGSGAYIDSLNPVEGTWKADGSVFVGLIAHEADEVSRTPIATGEKDGEEMQSMSYSSSEMMANILAELQSLRKRVAELEA